QRYPHSFPTRRSSDLEMRKAAKFYGRIWKSNLPTIREERTHFDMLIKKLNPEAQFDDDTIDLLNKLLDLISDNRITADEALFHRSEEHTSELQSRENL